MSAEGEPSSPTTDISECLEALRLAVGGDNQTGNTEELYNQNGHKHEREVNEGHLLQQIELIETMKHQVTGNHDNTADSSTRHTNDHQLLSKFTPAPQYNNGEPQYHRTCREEANCYPNDITVDELAGYLDELLYLPRPMSDMAELMYT